MLPELDGKATDRVVTIGTVTIELDLTAEHIWADWPIARAAASSSLPGFSQCDGGNICDGYAGRKHRCWRTVVRFTAHGSIGDIVLNDISDISDGRTSSLPKNPTNVVNATDEVTAAAIIIAEAYWIPLLTRRAATQ